MEGSVHSMVYYYNAKETSSVNLDLMEKYGCKEMSPALEYAGTTAFEDVLNDIKRGVIPTGTGEPFPVIWGNDDKQNIIHDNPSKPNFTNSNGFINPAPDLIKL